ncbi:hypothetical protein [Nocardia jinanensis]|uniref:DUF3263 domain-containing protein n=1 Tax=Nocardia jinanensis TaxID=382504 RepID=A0A917RJN3_9NOCA|nr:hypothetical protein [Nocardia jinanensis]GGL11769.1 hypothetical protein GCM10011588_27690 [Nocardia jinanensis]
MNDDDRMLAFAVKWRHWNGGPAEDIFVEFGIETGPFFRRLRGILADRRRNTLPRELTEHLWRICDKRLRVSATTRVDRPHPQRISIQR